VGNSLTMSDVAEFTIVSGDIDCALAYFSDRIQVAH